MMEAQPALERHVPIGAGPEVVAVVLADGTVQTLVGEESRDRGHRKWESGTISGSGWMLWWERRSFA